MTPPGGTRLSAYARSVERAWSAYVERPVLLSQRDWERIRDWHGRGIPLDVVRGAIDALAENRRRRSKARGLHAIAPAVDEEWSVLCQDGAATSSRDEVPAPEVESGPPTARAESQVAEPDAVVAWKLCLEGREPSALSALLKELLEDRERGVPAADLDRKLDDRLAEIVEPTVREALQVEIDRELEPWRARLPADDFAVARSRGLTRRLRRRLRLPRLAAPEPHP